MAKRIRHAILLTGCVADNDTRTAATRPDALWRVYAGDAELYLHRERDADPWRMVVVVHRAPGSAWRAEYRDFVGNLPRSIHLSSMPPGRFDLQLALSDVELNVPIEPETFRVQIPAGTTPITIDELRNAGPLAERSRKTDE